jgi:hypothetical protein
MQKCKKIYTLHSSLYTLKKKFSILNSKKCVLLYFSIENKINYGNTDKKISHRAARF